MIISIDKKKKLLTNQIQHLFLIKTLQKVDITGIYQSIIQALYDKPTASIILSGEKLKAFSLRSGKRQGCSLLPLLFSIVLEVLVMEVSEENGITGL